MKHTVTEHLLSTGTQGLVIDVPGGNVFNILVRFNSGHQFVDQSVYELPHVMEHLMASQSQKYPGSNELMIEAQKNGAMCNATTGADTNGYVYECADFELDRILDLLEEVIVRPLFTQAALDIERKNVREELSKYTTDHHRICSVALSEQAYPGQVLGYDTRLSQLDNISLTAIKEYYTYAFTATNARFYIAGPIGQQSEAFVARFERMFSQLPAGKLLVPRPDVGLNVPDPILQVRDISQLYYRSSLFNGSLSYPERQALSLMRLTLVGGFGSRIKGEARSRGLAYAIGMISGAVTGNSEVGYSGYVTPVNAADLFEVIVRHTLDIRNGGLTELELEKARVLGVGSTKRSYQTASDMLSWYVGPYEDDRRIDDFDAYLEALRSVSVDDIESIVGKMTGNIHHGVSFVGDISPQTAEELTSILSPLWS
jgi:predicted Zn-dependent peptidase